MNIKKNSKNNTYYFSISLGTDPITGKRRQTMRSGFKTIKQAEQEYSRIKLKYLDGKMHSNRKDISFTVLCELYAKERIDKIKTTTYNGEQGHIKIHILPYFEHANIKKMKHHDIVDFQEHLQSKKISNNTINKIMLSLKMICDFAIQQQYMQANPTQLVKRLKVEKKQMQFWTPSQFQQFIESVEKEESHMYVLFYTFAYLTGARLSEILACTWDDINFYTNTWRISKSLNYDKLTREYYLDTTKTQSSTRSVGLPNKLIQLLNQHKEDSQHDYIFAEETTHPNGRRFDRVFRKHIELSNVTPIRFHDLRHSHVALLIDMGEQDFIIKERLGHASIKITYDIYGHLFPTRQQELADRLDNIF